MSENKESGIRAIIVPYGTGYYVEVFLGEETINILARNGMKDLTKQESETICKRINTDVDKIIAEMIKESIEKKESKFTGEEYKALYQEAIGTLEELQRRIKEGK